MTAHTHRGLAALSTVAIVLAAAFGFASAAAEQPESNPTPAAETNEPATQSSRASAEAKLTAAERVCKMFHDRESGAPRGIAGAEANYLWSKRRMTAELELIGLKPEHGTKAAAIERHLDWMRAWHETVVESGAFSQYEIATTEYYIAEAEALLAAVTGP